MITYLKSLQEAIFTGVLYKVIKLSNNCNNFIEINSSFGYNKISIEKNGIKIHSIFCYNYI